MVLYLLGDGIVCTLKIIHEWYKYPTINQHQIQTLSLIVTRSLLGDLE